MWKFYHWSVFGCISFFVGRGFDLMFPDWQSPWTWWGMALGLVPFLIAPTLWKHRKAIFASVGGQARPIKITEEDADSIRTVFTALGALAFLAMLIAVVVFYERPPEPVWDHPTMTVAEQENAKAKCRMRAVEVVGAGDLAGRPYDRDRYVADCLTAKGFDLLPPPESDATAPVPVPSRKPPGGSP